MIRSILMTFLILFFHQISLADTSCSQYTGIVSSNGMSVWEPPPSAHSCPVINSEQEIKLNQWADEAHELVRDYDKLSIASFQSHLRKLRNNIGLGFFDYPLSKKQNGEVAAIDETYTNDILRVLVGKMIRIQMFIDLKVNDSESHPQLRQDFVPYQPTPAVQIEFKQKLKIVRKILSIIKSQSAHAFTCKLLEITVPTSLLMISSDKDGTWKASDVLQNTASNSLSVGRNGELNPSLENTYAYSVLEEAGLLNDLKFYDCKREEDLSDDPETPDNRVMKCAHMGLEDVLNLDPNPVTSGVHTSGTGAGDCSFIGATWYGNGKTISNFSGRLVRVEHELKSVFNVECSKINLEETPNNKFAISIDETSCRVKAPYPILRKLE